MKLGYVLMFETNLDILTKVDDVASDRSLLARFHQDVLQKPDQTIFKLYNGEAKEVASLTYLELEQKSNAIAHFLRNNQDFEEGERVLLAYPPTLDFIPAFLGCLKARLIAVPVMPPNPFNPQAFLRQFDRIAEDSGASAVLTNSTYNTARRMKQWQLGPVGKDNAWFQLPWIVTDRVSTQESDGFEHNPGSGEEVALLQYTSGSTSDPKGVVVSFDNLTHQIHAVAELIHFSSDSISVSWVPHYHDFGLICGILNSVMGYGKMHLLSPLDFLKRPGVWFDLVTRVRATHTAAPDFGFRMLIQRTPPVMRADWDLRSVRVIVSAAEPISHKTTQAFFDGLAPLGLDPAAFCPSYGLAEHTAGVTAFGKDHLLLDFAAAEKQVLSINGSGKAGKSQKVFIGCGKPMADAQVEIVNPHTRRKCPPDEIGEIWVHSPSKAKGYWEKPEITQCQFHAQIIDHETPDGYLRTGDLGFINNGEIYITGRIKDMMIVHGRNIYPQDIEDVVNSSILGIRAGRTIAFSIPESVNDQLDEGDNELIMVVAEVKGKDKPPSKLEALGRNIREIILGELKISCHAIVLARPGFVQKTTSGKLMRWACRQAYLDGSIQKDTLWIDTLGERSPPQGQAESLLETLGPPTPEKLIAWLIARIASVTGQHASTIKPEMEFAELAISSLDAVNLIVELEAWTQIPITAALLLEYPTLQAVVDHLTGPRGGYATGTSPVPSDSQPSVMIKIAGNTAERAPLFCFPAGYGDVFAIRNWGRNHGHSNGHRPMYSLQPPADSTRKYTLIDLLQEYSQSIRSVQPEGPYLLAGYSVGGLMSVALAEYLMEQGHSIGYLGLLDPPMPLSLMSYKTFLKFRKFFSGWQASDKMESLRLVRILRALFQDPGLARSVSALRSYQPEPITVKQATLFTPTWTVSHLKYPFRYWKKILGNHLRYVNLPGDHDSFIRPPHDQQLINQLNDDIH